MSLSEIPDLFSIASESEMEKFLQILLQYLRWEDDLISLDLTVTMASNIVLRKDKELGNLECLQFLKFLVPKYLLRCLEGVKMVIYYFHNSITCCTCWRSILLLPLNYFWRKA